eukprot:TRINITY_DN1948_c0_g3_i1.p1 TRINITY_DN1948_c0_g3~~TRINITY_DN1948_c0_g3_i1.p1  ORF type:complete len:300 (+),score=56.73 TRINITY_DN1948_c0_g3_i1:66-965(+)
MPKRRARRSSSSPERSESESPLPTVPVLKDVMLHWAKNGKKEAEKKRKKQLSRDVEDGPSDELREMLAQREREFKQETDIVRKREIEADVEILRGWLREKEEAAAATLRHLLLEDVLAKTEKDQPKAPTQPQRKQDKPLVQQLPVRPPVPRGEVMTLLPTEKAPPRDLPLWCVMPNLKHVEVVLEIVRHVAGSTVPAKRVCMGRRSWALLGRRLPADVEQPGYIEPDIGLASPRASRCHALVLQNWLGKLFLQDIGSTHGSFLGGKQLRPNEPCEWKPGVKAFFADNKTETFELRPRGT